MAGMDPAQLLSHARQAETAYLDTLQALVELESPSGDRAAAVRLVDHLSELLSADSWRVEREPREGVGELVRAHLEGRDPGDATLVLAHYDTVWPLGTLDVMPWRRDGDRVHGPGVLDMKAGIASAVQAARLLREAGTPPRGPVTLLVTSDEEIGSLRSREAIEAEARRHARVLVVEPGRDDGALKVGRKGVGDVRVRFLGRSAHAGLNPEQGASALREAAHFLFFAEDLGNPELGTTVNLTVARGGGAGNVVAERAEAQLDVRVLRMDEGERVIAALGGYRPRDPDVTIEVEGGMNRPPLEPTDANAALASEAHALLEAMGLRVGDAVVGGASDGNFTSAMGVPTLDGLGAVGEGPHARHEHIRVGATLERVALLAALLAGPG